MAQDHGLCRKKGKVSHKWTGARAATAGPCCSCQRDSLAACKHVGFVIADPGAHGMNRGQTKMNGGKQTEANERGRTDEGSGHGRQRVAAGTQPAEQALQADTAGGLSARLRPQTNGPQLAGLAAKKTAADDVGLSPCR